MLFNSSNTIKYYYSMKFIYIYIRTHTHTTKNILCGSCRVVVDDYSLFDEHY
jgi:hypothetical protein